MRKIFCATVVICVFAAAQAHAQKAPATGEATVDTLRKALRVCLALRLATPADEQALADCAFATAARFGAAFDALYGDYLDISTPAERAAWLARIRQDLEKR